MSSILPHAPPAKGPLARYRLLSPTSSVRVSPLCLGGMNFGDAWKHVLGECDHETTDSILDYYYEQGGNFIDTSNNYQFEESEKWIGEWMKKRGVRDQIVLATKYTTNFHAGRGDREIIVNFKAGLSFEQVSRIQSLGLAPWGSLGGGKFKTEEQYNKIKADEQNKKEGRAVPPSEVDIKVSKALEAVAKRKHTLVTSVAQAYVTSKAPYVFPIIGGRTLEHLKGNIEALNLKLSDEDINEVEVAVPFSIGFPNNFLYGGEKLPDHPGKVHHLGMGGTLDHVPEPKPFSKE